MRVLCCAQPSVRPSVRPSFVTRLLLPLPSMLMLHPCLFAAQRAIRLAALSAPPSLRRPLCAALSLRRPCLALLCGVECG